jgi:hypothetical protein
MTLNCKHCPAEFKSLDLRNEVALKECCEALISHVSVKHTGWMRTGKENTVKATVSIIWLLVIENHAAIPNTEVFIQGEVEKYRIELMKLLGIAVEGEKEVGM